MIFHFWGWHFSGWVEILTKVGTVGGEPLDQLLLGSSLEVARAILGSDKNDQSRLLVGLILLPPFLLNELELAGL